MKKSPIFFARLAVLVLSVVFAPVLNAQDEPRGEGGAGSAGRGTTRQIAPRSAQALIEPRHWIYDSLQLLAQECAIVQFSDQAPLTVGQVQAMLTEFDYDALSGAGKAHYDGITEYINERLFVVQASLMQLRLEIFSTLEGYVKTNDDVPWVYDRFEKQKFLELPVTVSVGDYVALGIDALVGLTKTAMNKNGTFINVPYDEYNFDVNFPHNAYGSAGYMFTDTVGMNLQVNNMAHSFGRADTGSIIQSGIPDATTAAFTVFSPLFQYSASLTALNTDRYLYAHKLDARFFKKVQFSLMEACLPYGSLDARFFNPTMLFHSYASWLDYKGNKEGGDVGSFLGAKISVVPVKYLRVFALWSMTQLQLPVEFSEDEASDSNYVPNAMGFQGGVESFIPIGGGHLRLGLEGYYAQPYLYINSSPNWSFVRATSESNARSQDFYDWIGTRYGPDTAAASFNARYEVFNKWAVSFKYLFLARGELSDPNIFSRVGWSAFSLDAGDDAALMQNWVYPRAQGNAYYKNGRNWAGPSGDVDEYVNVVSLSASYFITPFLRIMAQPSLAVVANNGHIEGKTDVSFECVLSLQCKFNMIKK